MRNRTFGSRPGASALRAMSYLREGKALIARGKITLWTILGLAVGIWAAYREFKKAAKEVLESQNVLPF